MVTPPGIPDEKVKKMKPSFKARYGDRWKEVLYATLWKHKGSYQEETITEDKDDDYIKSLENYAKGNVRANWMKGYEKSGPEFQEIIDKEKAALAQRRKEQADADRNLKNYQAGNVRANWRREETINENIDEHIVKVGSKYRLLSHKGKNLGTFDSKSAAAKHEGEVEYFKHHNEETEQLDEAKRLNLIALKRQYTRNENNNLHLRNATMLAQHFGSHEEHGRGLDLMKQHKELGSLPDGGMDYEVEMSKKYYPRLLGRNEETINEDDWERSPAERKAERKAKRDTYSDALKAKFDKIATPGKHGPTDPELLNIIHKFAVRRNELLKRINKEETLTEKKRDSDWEPIDPKDERIGDEGHKPKKKKVKEETQLDEKHSVNQLRQAELYHSTMKNAAIASVKRGEQGDPISKKYIKDNTRAAAKHDKARLIARNLRWNYGRDKEKVVK